MTELTLQQPYLVFRFYYATYTGDTPEPAGDHVLSHLISKLAEHRQAASVSLDFMRYSEGGYHIYLKIRGDEASLSALAEEYLAQLSQEYRDSHMARMGLKNELGEYSVRLHQRMGADPAATRPSGDFSVEWHNEDPELYESQTTFAHNLAFNDAFCRGVLALFKHNPSSQVLKLFARLLLSDLLLSSALTDEDSYYLLYFVRQQWVRFFDIDEQTLQQCADNAQRSAPKFHHFLDTKTSYKDSARMLPDGVGEVYCALFESLLPRFNHLIVRDDNGVVTNQTALRVISLLHLCHNRLGFDLNQEIIFSYLLSGYLQQQIAPQRIAQLLSGADLNIDNYVGDLGGLGEATSDNEKGTGTL
ncbi:hypothetical protein LJ739_07790 [Aestuariibacter halophilus]|uniref:Thiopeptide-type bacteriocin biosynthesis domain-containing protein n=1 Tax=Fluctibacter halophilus TaxID=226011 RepID=A0ABS8G6B8_9ALTE|nr:lantibiotic dehydratase C-terminal domain-containing protein [Aestuariibacter halophilus]MCC2616137.1 hypothetical protein [Aestuariibacter halophilus]